MEWLFVFFFPDYLLHSVKVSMIFVSIFFHIFFQTKAQTLFAKYLITMELSNLGVVLNKNLALTVFLTITGNS